jgi:ketosteroid isomerase-like protein
MSAFKLLTRALVAGVFTIAPAGHAQEVRPDEVIAVERAALDRWIRGDPQGFLDTYAPEITYFDPATDQRVDGLDAMRQLLGPLVGRIKIDRYEMVNPKVQRHGGIAVLTYNVVNYRKQPDGSEKPAARWNSTAVFRRIDGRWRTIHSHFSLTKPELNRAATQ